MSLHVFNKNQELFKVIKRNDLQLLEQQTELNVIDIMYTELDVRTWDSLEEKPYYIGIKDIEDEDSYLIYRIMEEQLNMNNVVIKGIGLGYDELKGKGYVPKQPFVKADVQLVMSQVLHNTGWELGYVDSKLGRYDFEIEASTPLDALKTTLEVMGAEVEFKITLNDNKITNKRINVYRKLGGDYGRRFSYGDDIVEIVREENLSEIVTALYVIGKDYQEPSEIEGADPLEYTMDIVGVEWDTAIGDPVDKPLGKPYIEIPEMTKVYGYPDGKPRMGVFEDTSAEDDKELISKAYEALVEYSRPKVQFTATIDSVNYVRLGETVSIIRPDLNFRYKTRVFKITRNHLNERVENIEFGDVLVKTPHQRYTELTGNIKQESDRLENVIQTAANGKNRIFRGPNEPTMGMIKGDLWYKPIGDGDTELHQWDGEMWARIVSTGVNSQIQQELDEANERIQEARDDMEETELKANSILKGLGIPNIEEANKEISDGIRELVGNRIDGLVTDIDEFGGSLDGRLDGIMKEIGGVKSDLDGLPDKTYVDQQVDSKTGAINTVIAGIIENPTETIHGYNIMRQSVTGNVNEIARVSSSLKGTQEEFQRVTETVDLYERVIGSNENDVKRNTARMVMAEDIFRTEISSRVKDGLSGFEISDRNLVKNSNPINVSSSANGISHSIISDNYLRVDVSPDNGNWMVLNIEVEDEHFKHGDEYTVSFEIKSFRGSKPPPKFMVNSSSGYKQVEGMATNEFTQVSYTGKWNTGGTTAYRFGWGDTSGLFHIKNLKIQKSSKATPWTPAIEDTEEVLDILSTSVTQLNDSWALRITSNEELVTAINASTEGVYVKGKYITLDGNVDISKDFTISGEMIAKGIKADNITTGTLNAANLRVINLDAESIVGENANLIKASFNAMQDNLQIDASGIYMLGSGTWRRTYTSATGFDMYNNRGGSGKAGAVGYFKEHSSNANSNENYIRSNKDSKHFVGIGVNNTHNFAIGYQEYGSIYNGYTRALEVDGHDGRIRIHTLLSPGGSAYTLNFRAYDGHSGYYGVGLNGYDSGIILGGKGTAIWDSSAGAWDNYNMHTRQKIGFYGNSGIHILTSNSNMELWAGGGGMLFYNRVNRLKMSLVNNLDMNTGINMGGYSISNQSDSRLKYNIHPTDVDSLSAIKKWQLVNYEWLEENKPKGIQFGLIAQDTPELAVLDEDSSFFNIDTSKQVMMVTHAIQQLAEEVDNIKLEMEKI